MLPFNLHTHTTFCDGKNTAEEMVLEAIRLGSPKLGFSGHAYTSFDDSCCMTIEGTKEYRKEILRLKEKYKDKIEILLGIEQDYYSDFPAVGYDYIIGSVHYVLKDGKYLCLDNKKETFLKIVKEYYNGDYYALCRDYYETVKHIYDKTHCDIIGHFDVITKYNENDELFNTDCEEYLSCAFSALSYLMKQPVTFEINYGAIARGHRTTPYPKQIFLDKLKENNCKTIKTSDCHKKEFLLFGLI